MPPIRVAASTPDTFPAIGAAGYPVFASTRHPTWDELKPMVKAYRDAYKAAGHKGEGEVYVSAPIYIAETEERALAEAEESVTHFYKLQYELIANRRAARAGRISSTAPRSCGRRRIATLLAATYWSARRRVSPRNCAGCAAKSASTASSPN